jgi:hypothetical protein
LQDFAKWPGRVNRATLAPQSFAQNPVLQRNRRGFVVLFTERKHGKHAALALRACKTEQCLHIFAPALHRFARNANSQGRKIMRHSFTTRARLMSGGAMTVVALLAFGTLAHAQTAPAPQDDDATTVDEIVVTGIRASIANSIAAKARNTSIVEVITAEDIG